MANKNNKNKTNNKKNNVKKENTQKNVNTSNNKKNYDNKNQKEVKNAPKKEAERKEIKKEEVIEEKVITKPEKKEKKKFELTSKQRDLILILLAAVLLVMALVLTGSKNKLDIELPVALEGTPGFNEVTYTEYEEKLNTEAPFLLIIVNDGCGYCDMYKPIVEEVANEYSLPINYVNLAHLSAEEREAFSTSNSWLKRNQWGTPTTLFMYGNDVVDTIEQYVDKDTFVEFVKENFVIGNNEDE